MANTRSAEKRNRQNQKRRARNAGVRGNLKSAIKKVRDALGGGDPGKAKAALGAATRVIDKACAKGILHRNAASRKISRLTAAVAKAVHAAK